MTIISNWAKDSACQNTDIDFYSSKSAVKKEAKALCDECPVKAICLQGAMDVSERWGVWGGTDEIERRKNLAIDSFGNPHVAAKGKIRCGGCGPLSSQYLEILEPKKRTKTHLRYTKCGLTWWTNKLINKRLSNL